MRLPCGQCGSQGSGSSSAISTARLDASGRRAHHRCRVEGCPCRIDFSRAACRETSAMGKSTSASRLQDLGIILYVIFCQNSYSYGPSSTTVRRFSCTHHPSAIRSFGSECSHGFPRESTDFLAVSMIWVVLIGMFPLSSVNPVLLPSKIHLPAASRIASLASSLLAA